MKEQAATYLFPPSKEEQLETERKALRDACDEFVNMPLEHIDKYRRMVRTVRSSKLSEPEISALLVKHGLAESRRSEIRLLANSSSLLYGRFMKEQIGFVSAVNEARREGLTQLELTARDTMSVRKLINKAAKIARRIRLKESLQVEFDGYTVTVSVKDKLKK